MLNPAIRLLVDSIKNDFNAENFSVKQLNMLLNLTRM